MTREPGEVRIRSNVTDRAEAWNLVPGELLRAWRPEALRWGGEATHLQREQSMYHVPCFCGRGQFEIETYGCDGCRFTPTTRELELRRRRHEATLERSRRMERAEQMAIEEERSGRHHSG